MMAQVTAASLASECKVLSHPASVDTIPTDGNKEDVVPMAMGAAWKLRRIVSNVAARARHRAAVRCAGRSTTARPLQPARRVERACTRTCASSCRRSSDDRVLTGDIATIRMRSATAPSTT